jgi:hypothetical protein
MDCVFKSQQHKSNLIETTIRLLFLFHLGNCLTDLFPYSYWIWCMCCNTLWGSWESALYPD